MKASTTLERLVYKHGTIVKSYSFTDSAPWKARHNIVLCAGYSFSELPSIIRRDDFHAVGEPHDDWWFVRVSDALRAIRTATDALNI